MDIDNVIKSRRSVRKYALDKKGNPEKVDLRKIFEIIDAARYAPMAGGIFSLKFILVLDREKIKKIAELADQEFIANAFAVVVVCSDEKQTKRFYEERGERYLRQQAGAAIQNILLKATSEGLATVWVGHFYDRGLKELLGIPEEIFVEALIPISKPYPNLKLREKFLPSLKDILYFDKWKGKAIKEKILRE
jgi:nitroreductase